MVEDTNDTSITEEARFVKTPDRDQQFFPDEQIDVGAAVVEEDDEDELDLSTIPAIVPSSPKSITDKGEKQRPTPGVAGCAIAQLAHLATPSRPTNRRRNRTNPTRTDSSGNGSEHDDSRSDATDGHAGNDVSVLTDDKFSAVGVGIADVSSWSLVSGTSEGGEKVQPETTVEAASLNPVVESVTLDVAATKPTVWEYEEDNLDEAILPRPKGQGRGTSNEPTYAEESEGPQQQTLQQQQQHCVTDVSAGEVLDQVDNPAEEQLAATDDAEYAAVDDENAYASVSADNTPAGWTQYRTAENDIYYYNEVTQEVQWEPPEQLPQPQQLYDSIDVGDQYNHDNSAIEYGDNSAYDEMPWSWPQQQQHQQEQQQQQMGYEYNGGFYDWTEGNGTVSDSANVTTTLSPINRQSAALAANFSSEIADEAAAYYSDAGDDDDDDEHRRDPQSDSKWQEYYKQQQEAEAFDFAKSGVNSYKSTPTPQQLQSSQTITDVHHQSQPVNESSTATVGSRDSFTRAILPTSASISQPQVTTSTAPTGARAAVSGDPIEVVATLQRKGSMRTTVVESSGNGSVGGRSGPLALRPPSALPSPSSQRSTHLPLPVSINNYKIASNEPLAAPFKEQRSQSSSGYYDERNILPSSHEYLPPQQHGTYAANVEAALQKQKPNLLNKFRPGLPGLTLDIDESDRYKYSVPPFVQSFAVHPRSPSWGRRENMSVSDLSDTDGTWQTDGTLPYNAQQLPLPHLRQQEQPRMQAIIQGQQQQVPQQPQPQQQHHQQQRQQPQQQPVQPLPEESESLLQVVPRDTQMLIRPKDDGGNDELLSWSRTKPPLPPNATHQSSIMTLPPRPPQVSKAPPYNSPPPAAPLQIPPASAMSTVSSQGSMASSHRSNSSGERHLAIWNRFFANAFNAAEGGAAASSPTERSRAASAARSQWPQRPSDAEFVSLMSVARQIVRRREKMKAIGSSYDEEEISLQLDRAMLAAMMLCDLSAAEELLLMGANPGSQTADWPGERSPAHFAVRYVDHEFTPLNRRGMDDEGESSDHNGMDHKAVKCLALLSDYGADIEAEDAAGRRPLHVAAAFGCFEALRFLLESAADVTAVDSAGNSALQLGKSIFAILAPFSDLFAILPPSSELFPSDLVVLPAAAGGFSACCRLLLAFDSPPLSSSSRQQHGEEQSTTVRGGNNGDFPVISDDSDSATDYNTGKKNIGIAGGLRLNTEMEKRNRASVEHAKSLVASSLQSSVMMTEALQRSPSPVASHYHQHPPNSSRTDSGVSTSSSARGLEKALGGGAGSINSSGSGHVQPRSRSRSRSGRKVVFFARQHGAANDSASSDDDDDEDRLGYAGGNRNERRRTSASRASERRSKQQPQQIDELPQYQRADERKNMDHSSGSRDRRIESSFLQSPSKHKAASPSKSQSPASTGSRGRGRSRSPMINNAPIPPWSNLTVQIGPPPMQSRRSPRHSPRGGGNIQGGLTNLPSPRRLNLSGDLQRSGIAELAEGSPRNRNIGHVTLDDVDEEGEEEDNDEEDDDDEEEEEEQEDAMTEMVWGVASSLIGITMSMFGKKSGGRSTATTGSVSRRPQSSSSSSAESETNDEDEELEFDRKLQSKLAVTKKSSSAARFGWVWGGNKSDSDRGCSSDSIRQQHANPSGNQAAVSWSQMTAPPTDTELRSRGLGHAPPVLVAEDIYRHEDSVRSGNTPRLSNPRPPADVSIALAVAKHQLTPRKNNPSERNSHGTQGYGPPIVASNGYSLQQMPRGVSWRYVDVLNSGNGGNDPQR